MSLLMKNKMENITSKITKQASRNKNTNPVVLNLGFANPQGFTGRFPGVLGLQLSFHV